MMLPVKLQMSFQNLPSTFSEFKQFLIEHIPLDTDYNTIMFQFNFDFENQQLTVKIEEPHMINLLTLTNSTTYFVLYDISKDQFFVPYYIEYKDAYLQCFGYLYDLMKFYLNDPLCFRIIDVLSGKFTTRESFLFIVNKRWNPLLCYYINVIVKIHTIWYLLNNTELIQLIRGVANEITTNK